MRRVIGLSSTRSTDATFLLTSLITIPPDSSTTYARHAPFNPKSRDSGFLAQCERCAGGDDFARHGCQRIDDGYGSGIKEQISMSCLSPIEISSNGKRCDQGV